MGELRECPFCQKINEGERIVDARRILGEFNFIHRCRVVGPMEISREQYDEVESVWNRRPIEDALRARVSDLERRNAELVRVSRVIQDAFGSPKTLELAIGAYGVEGDSSCMSDYQAFYDMAAEARRKDA